MWGRALAVVLGAVLSWAALAGIGACQTQPTAVEATLPRKTLRVGVKVAPPFLEKDKQGLYKGLAYDLWADIASDLGLRYETVEYDLEGLLDAVRRGTVDAGVSDLSMTAEREEVMDFSQPFYYTGLGIAVPVQTDSPIVRLFHAIVTEKLLYHIGVLLALLLCIGSLVWLLERRRNPEHFRPGARGIGDGMWWSAVTMTSVGYGDATPKTLYGRALAMVWMFASVVILASFTAGITSSLTVDTLSGRVHGPDDLHLVRTGVVAYSSGEEELIAMHVGVRPYPSLEAGLAALIGGELDAFVHDKPVLHYYRHKRHSGEIRVLHGFFDPQLYAFAFPHGSPLRKAVNVAMLRRLEDSKYRAELYGPYLGKDAIK